MSAATASLSGAGYHKSDQIMAGNSQFQNFIDELKRRRVFRVATLYVVSFWPIIQIVDILSPALELPDSVMRYLVIAFATGFPLALILAWIFDVNKDGVTVTESTEGTANTTPLMGNRSEFAVIASLIALVGVLFLVQLSFSPDEKEDKAAPQQQQLVTPAVPGREATAGSRSVAVLPFVAFSESAEDQQFADGLTEELLNVLARVQQLRVAARTSTFAYRGVNKDIIKIGQELRVGTILEGSVRRNDVNDTIRVTAQLIDAQTGSHLWSKTYDREFSDVFRIQDDIAAAVVDELQITLLGDERKKIQSRRKANPEAVAVFGVAQAELARRSQQSLTDAIRFFERALSLDPEYTEAFSGIATARALKVSYAYTDDTEVELTLAEEALQQAFTLEPESGSAWATRGLIHMQRKDNDLALEALEKAMEFNPSHAQAVMWYAGLQHAADDKLAWYRKAYELDPRSTIIGYNIANILFSRGNEAEAMEIHAQMLEADPHYHSAYNLAGQMAESRGRIDEAINQYTYAFELAPSIQYAMKLARLYTDLGDFEQSQYWIGQLDDYSLPAFGIFVDWLQIAAYASVGQMEQAEPLLRQKVAQAAESAENLYLEDAATAAYYLGDADAVINLYEQITGEATIDHFNNSNRVDAMVAAARTYQLRGDHDAAAPIIADLDRLMTELEEQGMRHFSFWTWKSRVSVLQGEPRMALIQLQRAIDEGMRSHWAINLDPTFAALKDQPAFSGMIAGLETRMSIMREQLAIAGAFDSDWPG